MLIINISGFILMLVGLPMMVAAGILDNLDPDFTHSRRNGLLFGTGISIMGIGAILLIWSGTTG